VFRDFVTAGAVAMSKLDLRRAEAREDFYMSCYGAIVARRHGSAKMLAELEDDLHVAPARHPGRNLHVARLGQRPDGSIFTPHHICGIMASLTRSDNIEEKVSKRGLMTIYEPASGSGAIVIAMMLAMQNRGLSDSFMSA
jgi:hypothetical protein